MNQDQFLDITDKIFDHLFKQLDEYDFDVDFLDGNIHIYIQEKEQNKEQEYIINKHSFSKQIWLSSPVSGAHHFSYFESNKTWISSSGEELLKVLSKDLNVELSYV